MNNFVRVGTPHKYVPFWPFALSGLGDECLEDFHRLAASVGSESHVSGV